MPLKIKGWDNIPSFCTCLVGFMSVAMDMFYLSGIFRWVMSSCPTGDDEREASRVREWKRGVFVPLVFTYICVYLLKEHI